MSIISALIAASYILSVTSTLFITACAFDRSFTRELFTHSSRRLMILVDLLASGVTEQALHLVVLKLITIKLVNFLGGFRYTLSSIAYLLDIVNMVALGVLFYEMVAEKSDSMAALKLIDAKSETIKKSLGVEDMKRLLNPIWSPDSIRIHSNITYATNEEIRDALNTTSQDFDQPRKMMLDIYTHDIKKTPSSGLQPVLVHIHGGSWQTGSKNIFYPHMKFLVKENNWLAVNIGYRLAPKNAYPTHLMDVKRALRWLKQNIASFGGDPNFIVLSGDSSGAHLAAMASMTVNDPQYQPGFEQADTSVRGVISLSGVLEIVENVHRAAYFSKQVANLDKVDMDFLSQHSPSDLIEKSKQENKLVPFLLIAGERDMITESNISKSFKKAYDQATTGSNTLSCSLVLFPAGHHISYVGWSPRSIFTARIIQSWCTQLYVKNK